MKSTGDYYEAELRSAYCKDEQRRWLDDLVDRLSACGIAKCNEGQYWNHPQLPPHLRVEGYYCCYQLTDRTGHPQYAMISRSKTSNLLDLKQIIEDLGSQEIAYPFEKFGDYFAQPRHSRGPGKFATIRFGLRWYMLSVCGQFKPYFKLVSERHTVPKRPLSLHELKERLVAKNNSELIDEICLR